MNSRKNISYKRKVFEIFSSFIKVGAFTFGSGYAMLPMIKREIVEHKQWMSEEDMVSMVAISEATPGPIMVNVATFVGYRIGGVFGAIAATMGVVIPSFCMILLAAIFISQINHFQAVKYAFEGIRAGVLVLIVKAIMMVYHNCPKNYFSYILIAVAFVVVAFAKINVIYMIIAAAMIGIIRDAILRRT